MGRSIVQNVYIMNNTYTLKSLFDDFSVYAL